MLHDQSVVELDRIQVIATVPPRAPAPATGIEQVPPPLGSREVHSDAASLLRTAEANDVVLEKGRSTLVIAVLSLVVTLNSVSNGLITVSIPRMAADLELSEGLLLWPQSVYGLTSGSCLLLAGSVADVTGSRVVNLTGTFLLGCFMIACGLSRTGVELIMLRAMQGVALALCLPTSQGILSTAIASGARRNVAFSCLGAGQTIGYGVGLVLSGVFTDTIGWRTGWYVCGALTLCLFLASVWALPVDRLPERPTIGRLAKNMDCVGAALASGCLAMLSYVLAMVTSDAAYIRQPANIVLLSVSLALIPAFIFWVGRQEKLGRPALIPNSIWKDKAFTSICLMVLLSFAVTQTMELFVSLFFQQVQRLSAIQTSIRLLPAALVGLVLELTTGMFVHRFSAMYLVVISSLVSAGAPLLMALIETKWPYWYDAFFVQLLMYFSIDVLFTVGILIISDVFSPRKQALAGAVFNVMAQFGISFGLAAMGVISSSVTQRSKYPDKSSPEALEGGYKATFWTALAWMLVTCCIGVFGLRKVGKVGVKRD